jgi:hypothetical protein
LKVKKTIDIDAKTPVEWRKAGENGKGKSIFGTQ